MIVLQACVSKTKLEEAQHRYRTAENKAYECDKMNAECEEYKQNLKSQIALLQKNIDRLKQDSALMSNNFKKQKNMNEELNVLYQKQIEANKNLLENAVKNNEKLNEDLASADDKLRQKEKELNEKDSYLRAKEAEIAKREAEIKGLQENTTSLQSGLKEREQRVQELEKLLQENERKSNELKNAVSKALTSFDASELTVTQRDGKVYVSLSEKLLFASGSTVVDTKGVSALSELAKVLNSKPDIDVTIEGHTDNVSLKSSNFPKDNWDLSVLRATSIVKILTQQKLNPKRIIASGRSEYLPLNENKTADEKAKNRRTEIILTPKMDKILTILDSKKD